MLYQESTIPTQDRISPTHQGIVTYLSDLRQRKYQIPTFQRNVVWDKENTKLLWDSIFRFYPLGSILIWKTGIPLHRHRQIGGHEISTGEEVPGGEYRYIVDGQQRTTGLLTSLYGGKIDGQEGFDPSLFVDLTVEDTDDLDSRAYRDRFLYWSEVDPESGITQNVPRYKRYAEGLVVRLRDIYHEFGNVERALVDAGYQDYDHPYRERLRLVKAVLDNYRLAFIELKGIQVPEVCQIFERINRAGKPLGIFDIIVAKTYRPSRNGQQGFYLRELLEGFREGIASEYRTLGNRTLLEMLACLIMENVANSGVYNVTERYLSEVKASHIEQVWQNGSKAMLRTFDFLDNHLHLTGPKLIPYRYIYMSLVTYFYGNAAPDYDLLQKYFWFHALHENDTLSNTTHLREHVKFLKGWRQGERPGFETFVLDRHTLRKASYHSRSARSQAILAFMASQEPRDWANPQRRVHVQAYYCLEDKPNLHHIFPVAYIGRHPGSNKIDVNSLMNIAYLTQQTNQDISDANPLTYLRDYDRGDFEEVLESHLAPAEILGWARERQMPDSALDEFIEARIDCLIERIERKLVGISMDIRDTRPQLSSNLT